MCGWRNMTVAVYSSKDLTNWKLETLDAVPEMHTNLSGINSRNTAFFEPAVLYNKKYDT